MLAVPIALVTHDLRFIEKEHVAAAPLFDGSFNNVEERARQVLLPGVGCWRVRDGEVTPTQAKRPDASDGVADGSSQALRARELLFGLLGQRSDSFD